MKKIILASLAIAAMAACSKNEDSLAPQTDSLAAEFSSYITTRVSGTEWEDDDAVGIMAIQNDTLAQDYRYNNMHNVVFGSDASVCTFEPNSAADKIYYSAQETDIIDFYAYYPYSQELDPQLGIYPIDVLDQSDSLAVDLMDVKTLEGYNRDSQEVELVFERRMAKFSLKVKAGDGLSSSQLYGVKIKGFYTTASYDLLSGEFTDLSGHTSTITPYTEPLFGVHSAMLIPVYNSRATYVAYFYTAYGTISMSLSKDILVAGQHTYYTVVVNRTEAEIEQNIILEWNENEYDGQIEAQ